MSDELKTMINSAAIKRVNIIVILVAFYASFQIFADIGSLLVGTIAGFTMGMGTLVYPFTFTIRDALHKSVGKRATQTLIIICAAINVFMVGYFWIIGQTSPADDQAIMYSSFNTIFAPVWRITAASIIAEVVSELVDTEIFHRLHKSSNVASFFSNLVSVPLDSIIFIGIAFYGILPMSVMWAVFVSNVVLKYVFATMAIPLLMRIK